MMLQSIVKGKRVMDVGEDGDKKDDRLLKRRGVSSGKEVRRGSDEQSTHLYDPVEVVTRGTSICPERSRAICDLSHDWKMLFKY